MELKSARASASESSIAVAKTWLVRILTGVLVATGCGSSISIFDSRRSARRSENSGDLHQFQTRGLNGYRIHHLLEPEHRRTVDSRLRDQAATIVTPVHQRSDKPRLDLRKERHYAEEAKTWSHGDQTEDMLLQRIWNLSEAMLKACDEIEALREALQRAQPYVVYAADELPGQRETEEDKALIAEVLGGF